MLSAIRLPLLIDAAELAADAAGFDEGEWVPHFNRQCYEGDWSGVALRSVGGLGGRLYANPASTDPFLDTPDMARTPHCRDVLTRLHCDLLSVRFLRLGPGARILDHTDYNLGFDDGEVRLHVPVTTGPDVTFLLDNQPVDMAAGEIWYLNLNLTHAATNTGSQPRVHLVIDCVVNEWLTDLLRRGEQLTTIVGFLDEIGVPVRFSPLDAGTPLPGVSLDGGALVVDVERLTHPGDLLHEAGHFALLTHAERNAVRPGDRLDDGDEMGAIAWSWAALRHLGLDPAAVFHDDGYRGGGASIIEHFEAGEYFGVPILEWRGLTTDFPEMTSWLRATTPG